MDKRGVYFFVIDAFLGGAIVVVSLLIILSSYNAAPEGRQPLTLMEDYLTYLQNTEVRDFQGPYTQSLIDNGTIDDPSNTLFEQVAEFNYYNESNVAKNFIEEITQSSVPQQFNLKYKYDGSIVYEKKKFPMQDSGLMLSSKKVSMVPINRTRIYGPHVVEVLMWTS